MTLVGRWRAPCGAARWRDGDWPGRAPSLAGVRVIFGGGAFRTAYGAGQAQLKHGYGRGNGAKSCSSASHGKDARLLQFLALGAGLPD